MNCPRCDSLLRWVEPNAVWLGHYVCDECFLGFYKFRAKVGRVEKVVMNTRTYEVVIDEWQFILVQGIKTREEVENAKLARSSRSAYRHAVG